MEFLISYYHSFWFVLTIAVVVCVLAVYLYRLAAKRLIFDIGYSRSFSESELYCGEKVILTETIYNPTRVPMFFSGVDGFITGDLKLTEYTGRDDRMQYFFSEFRVLMPHMKIVRSHEILCRKRGVYTVESVDIYLAGSRRHVECPASVCVYPHPVKVSGMLINQSRVLGDEKALLPLTFDPFSRSGLREYLPGDPMNMINFKASARTGGFLNGKLLVNKYDQCSGRTVMIYLNLRQSKATEDNNERKTVYQNVRKAMSGVQFEKMVEYALSQSCRIMLSAVREGYRAGFAVNSVCPDSRQYVRFRPTSGDVFLKNVLRFMAELKIAAGVSFSKILSDDVEAGMTGTEVYVFTAYGDPDIEKNIRSLKNAGNNVKVFIMEPEEPDEKIPENSDKTE